MNGLATKQWLFWNRVGFASGSIYNSGCLLGSSSGGVRDGSRAGRELGSSRSKPCGTGSYERPWNEAQASACLQRALVPSC